jgi:hypothetical protein
MEDKDKLKLKENASQHSQSPNVRKKTPRKKQMDASPRARPLTDAASLNSKWRHKKRTGWCRIFGLRLHPALLLASSLKSNQLRQFHYVN